ncbi:sigma-70 family RNA polymerase sigma factor [Thermomicrobium sp.]
MTSRTTLVHKQPPDLTDEELVARFRSGDREAFALLYERYVDRIYDFVVRSVRDREVAADLTQDTFLKAMQGLRARHVQGSLRAWLFTIARNTVIDYQRRHRTTAFSQLPSPEGEEWVPELPASGPEAEPEETARRRELAELVWQAARGLPPSDYTILELALRHDLTPAEVARVVGVRRGAINTRLSRVRDALEESFTVLLLARRGREDCPELARLLEGVALPQGLTPELRRAVARHVDQCEICQRNRRAVSAVDLLPALAPVLPALEVRAQIRQALEQAAATPGPTPHAVRTLRERLGQSVWGKALAGLVAGVTVLVSAGWAYLSWGTAPVTVETRNCPPLELRLAGPAELVSRALGVPSLFVPEQPAMFRLPVGDAEVQVSEREATLRFAGIPVRLRILADLAEVSWDGEALLGQGPVQRQVSRASPPTVVLVCR